MHLYANKIVVIFELGHHAGAANLSKIIRMIKQLRLIRLIRLIDSCQFLVHISSMNIRKRVVYLRYYFGGRRGAIRLEYVPCPPTSTSVSLADTSIITNTFQNASTFQNVQIIRHTGNANR